jgi:Zn-dependent peptidase ImmA (M78 family)
MKEIVAKRIKSARTLAGLSLRQLSLKMDGLVSHNAITKYENGLMMPDSKVLLALAMALNVKTDYFFRPYTVQIENIEFRKKSKSSIKNTKAIQQEVTDSIERYIEIEQFLNISSEFNNPIKHIEIKSGKNIETAVNQLLTNWKLGFNGLSNVIELLEDKGIKLIELETEDDFDGLSGWANNTIPVIVINKKFSIERKRFTSLHELGHLLLSFNSELDSKAKESLCHRFAGAMLIPMETMLLEIGKPRKNISISELVEIKKSYGISMQAIMARAKDLGIITQDYFVMFRIWINQSDERKKEIGYGQYIGNEQSGRFKQLIYRAAAEEIISMSKAANLSNQKLATFRDEFIAI